MATLVPKGKESFSTSSGSPLVGGKIYTYDTGTNNPRPTYSDAAGTVPNTNPVILDARGEAAIFWTGVYRVVLKDSLDNTIWTVDGVSGLSSADLSSTAGSGLVGFLYAAVYGAGTIGKWLQDLATSAGSTFIGFIQAGAGAVLRTLQDKMRDSVSVIDFGGVMNSSVAGVRTANSAALLAALAANVEVRIPAGTFWVATGIDWSSYGNAHVVGAGIGITTIKGDGDLFKLTSQATFKAPHFRDFTIVNDVTPGKLFTIATGADINKIKWTRVQFLNANYHIYSTDLCVAHTFLNCEFNGALIASRAYVGLWVMTEVGTYCWFNAIGLLVFGGIVSKSSSSTCSSHGSVYELNTGPAISLQANLGDILGWSFFGCHFENNGTAAGAADVLLQTVTANQIRGVMFEDCGWFAPNILQTVRVSQVSGGGGNIFSVVFRGGYAAGSNSGAAGAPYLTTANSLFSVIEPSVSFQVLGIPPGSNVLPVALLANGGFKGSNFTAGANAGSAAVIATVTPPANWKLIDFTVQGNFFNGVTNTHTGYLIGKVYASGSRVVALFDVNNGSGANQGFVATWTGAALQIANKGAMTANQSGDVTSIFYA